MNANPSHPSPGELAAYVARRLPAPDVLRISDHLAACASCHETLTRLRPPMERVSGEFLLASAGVVPDFDDLAGEVDGTLPPARHEQLAAELARSPAAREALADLAAFRDELAGLPPKHHHADNAPSARPAAAVNNVITPSLWHWRKTTAWAATLAALFVALAVGWWAFARRGPDAAELLRASDGRTAKLAGLPADLRAAVETAVRTGQLPSPAPTLAAGRETLAGQAARSQMAALSPVGIVVRAPRPSLQWTPRDGATGYVVSVAAADGSSLLTSLPLPSSQTQWTPPEPLARGQTYQWQVEALRDDAVIDRAPKPPAGEANFQILDAPTDQTLAELEAHDAAFPLLLGVAYWRAGLTAAAANQFQRLARGHTNSVIAQQLEHTSNPPASR